MRKPYYDFLIDGKPVLMPDEGISITAADMEAEDSGTDESGVLHRFLLREKVLGFSLSYDVLTHEEYRYMRSLVAGKSSFRVKYRDPDGKQLQLTAYCSGYSLALHNVRLGLYKGLKLDIQEC